MLNSSRPTHQMWIVVVAKTTTTTHFTQKFQSNTQRKLRRQICISKMKTTQKTHSAFDFNVIRILKYDFKQTHTFTHHSLTVDLFFLANSEFKLVDVVKAMAIAFNLSIRVLRKNHISPRWAKISPENAFILPSGFNIFKFHVRYFDQLRLINLLAFFFLLGFFNTQRQ